MSKAKLTLAEFLPYQLSITSNAVSDLIARSYQGRFGLKIPEWRVMAVLGEAGLGHAARTGGGDRDGQGDGQSRVKSVGRSRIDWAARRMKPMAARIILR